ncbi:hypothetical protein GQ457_13G000890 [Hibiscus cannabinus]
MSCKEESEVFRPIATFPQNIWRDQFPLTDDLSQVFDSLTKEIDPLKEKVKDMLMASAADPIDNIQFIDTLLRLGVSYHFENDIENQLDCIFSSHQNDLFSGNDLDLNSTSIVHVYMLLTNSIYESDVFKKFKDTDGKFKEILVDDVRGMLSLYEAVHLRVHGELILEEALVFTTANLKSLAKNSSAHLEKQITNALDQPLNKCPPRLAARTYISFYEEEDSKNDTLLKFAKLDFNRVQALHKQEINQIIRFWDDNKFSSELSYARERYVEAYTWINILFDEPRYTQWRIIVSKILQPISILDDTFDAYGTPQELQRLIDTLKRWDVGVLDELQDYTKVICKAVLVVFDEIAEEARKDGRSYAVPFAKDALVQLANDYQAEVKWYHDGSVPTFEEYMRVTMKTSTFDVLLTIAFIGMGEVAGIQAFEWLRNDPKIMKATNVIGRLMDDIVSHKFEQLREHAPSSVECYMKQHNLSEERTLKDFEKLLEDAWKDVNEECMRPTAIPRDLLIRPLNFARASYLFYKHGDGFTNPEYVKDDIRAILVYISIVFPENMPCKEENEIFRPIATFSQNIWRDQFPATDDLVFDSLTKEIYPLKEKVKDMLMASAADPIDNIQFIDTLLRLGVSYHFENDIENQLDSIFSSHRNGLFSGNDLDLNSTSIVFRVFRQYGLKMSCDVFNKFKDTDGKFKEILVDDVRGMLSLYEAVHLRVHGELILEEALVFTTANLKSLAKNSSAHLEKQITNALDQPLNRCPSRLAARTYISFYEEEESKNDTLLKFAKQDFNRLQALHKQEISQITRFWDDNKFSSELSYARERYVEAYTWINAIFDEPCYTQWRIIVSKILQSISILDDTFDAYGTPQELQRLIDTLKRWEVGALDELQDYTKVICKAVLVVFDEIAEEAMKHGRSYAVPFAKDAFIQLANDYQAEVKWHHEGSVPTFEEYMRVVMKTSTFDVLLTIAFIGMGEVAGLQEFEWLRNDPKIMKAINVIGRLMDDIVSHKFEQRREHASSSVECYMKQHNLSEECTLKDFEKLLEDVWKDVNEECMRPTAVPRDLLIRPLNLARASYLFYKHGDGFTNPEYVKDDIRAMFVDPYPFEDDMLMEWV